ncbi:cytochrome c oxidase accessory protein CcoG [Marivirga atlantica]|jgi:cytochrome c oxidase accessory protein FixG|uniref:Cytochrome c oxidase accessory protein CcoG n=1 Tax=Marivirga atlantica TaxID=1548457 RepID=A0A937ABT3_9BACT|nr:cytochrome c oxidase accessory protein CcoG [Marivirga atlantica]MBL0766046.1 cytochrome c oxidase accessory protein CcoG [Marivirga atlantica]
MDLSQENFRGQLATVGEKGKRNWIYPKKPKGIFHNYRRVVAWLLLALFFSGPFITIGGHPLLLFNIFDRKFVILGSVFWPQDTHLLIFLLLIFVVFVLLFTVVFGRVWCGWACPQTVFMEMVFRKIEYWIEGDANQQRKLKAAPWTFNKIWKKTLKQVIFLLIALWVSHTFMAYLLGIEEMTAVISSGPQANWSGFVGLIVFTGIFYFVFAYFREQACTLVCPYGRLQGVFLDRKSIVVIYDWLRGEPRGKMRKKEPVPEKGDCIDCSLCVQVCPTGIDIRNGTQMECVNCTACIDACDEVMTKINKPKGLIRFDSVEGVENKTKKLINARVLAYSAVLVILLCSMGFLLLSRSPVEASLTRTPGAIYQMKGDSLVSNMYQIELINKSFDSHLIAIELEEEQAQLFMPAGEIDSLNSQDKKTIYFFIEVPKNIAYQMNEKAHVKVLLDNTEMEVIKTSFPIPPSLKK